jgi:uncharacterized protein YukE
VVNVPHYPDQADEVIRNLATLVGNGSALALLDLIRDKLLGDSDKVDELAKQWAGNTVMQDTRRNLQATTDVLGSYWQGPAYQQFDKYAGNLLANLDANQSVMTSFAAVLTKCAEKVMSTYSDAVKLIWQAANDLLILGAMSGLVFVPYVDLITGPVLIVKALDKLDEFVKSVGDLVANAMNTIASYRSEAVTFVSNATNFRVPEPLGAGTGAGLGNANEWHVAPYNK